MVPFFIASLPRSRTAWLANFLTFGPSYCFHEPMDKCRLEDYPRLLASPRARYAGVSDSLNALIMEELIDLFPGAKVVVVRREIGKVAESLKRLGLECDDLLLKIDRELDRIEHAYRPLVIRYEEFDAARIWRFLIDEPLNYDRLKMLEKFNLTVPEDVIKTKGLDLMVNAGDLLWPILR